MLGSLLFGALLTSGETAFGRGAPCQQGGFDCIIFDDYYSMSIGMAIIGALFVVALLAFRRYVQRKDYYVVKHVRH